MTSDIRLTIDLGAIAANWRDLAVRVTPAECAAVVKANAYGLGIEQVAPALWHAECRSFFVAHLSEGLDLRALLPEAVIYILNGVPPGEEDAALAARLIPVVNGLDDLARLKEAWMDPSPLGRGRGPFHQEREGEGLNGKASEPLTRPTVPVGRPLPQREVNSIALHIDTGINRLGLNPRELERLQAEPELLAGVRVALAMSHLAISEAPTHHMNRRQQERFTAALPSVPAVRASLANSSGIFLGRDFHFDLVRPGVALFGANPTPAASNPMRNVVTLEARILKLQSVAPGETVGYGADFLVSRPSRIATLSIGYADGLPRCLGNRGSVFAAGRLLPIVGRISMDTMTVDATDVAEGALQPGDFVEVIGPHLDLDVIAAEAGTIAYEILTGLGSRPKRVYVNGSVLAEERT